MRGRILEAALTLYTSRPPQSVTTREIAREAKVSTGLVFHYFKNKDELEKEAVWYFIEKCTPPDIASLEEFVKLNLKLIKSNPGVFRFLQYVFEKEKYSGSKELASKIYETGLRRLSPILNNMGVEDVEKTATLLMAIIDGLALYSFFLDLDVEEFTDVIMKCVGCNKNV
jgi:AcrR family transcriptional regulator